MNIETHDISVSQGSEGATGTVTVHVHAESETEALAALQEVLQAVESVESGSDLPITWDGAESDTDGESGGEADGDPPGQG